MHIEGDRVKDTHTHLCSKHFKGTVTWRYRCVCFISGSRVIIYNYIALRAMWYRDVCHVLLIKHIVYVIWKWHFLNNTFVRLQAFFKLISSWIFCDLKCSAKTIFSMYDGIMKVKETYLSVMVNHNWKWPLHLTHRVSSEHTDYKSWTHTPGAVDRYHCSAQVANEG